MKKIILFIVLIISLNCVKKQENKEKEIIKKFILNVYDNKKDTKDIVDFFLEIKDDRNIKLSLEQRKLGAENIIKNIRSKTIENNALTPKYLLDSILNFNIFPYEDFKHIDKYNINGIETVKENVYILLDDKKENILQYFLFNKKHTKIISFSLFVKSDLAWFFKY